MRNGPDGVPLGRIPIPDELETMAGTPWIRQRVAGTTQLPRTLAPLSCTTSATVPTKPCAVFTRVFAVRTDVAGEPAESVSPITEHWKPVAIFRSP